MVGRFLNTDAVTTEEGNIIISMDFHTGITPTARIFHAFRRLNFTGGSRTTDIPG